MTFTKQRLFSSRADSKESINSSALGLTFNIANKAEIYKSIG